MPDRDEARAEALAWLNAERGYVQAKWGVARPEIDAELAEDHGERFTRDVEMYLHRARVLGLANPLGRQALAKGLSTMLEYVTSVVLVYGDFPPAGVPSGELSNA